MATVDRDGKKTIHPKLTTWLGGVHSIIKHGVPIILFQGSRIATRQEFQLFATTFQTIYETAAKKAHQPSRVYILSGQGEKGGSPDSQRSRSHIVNPWEPRRLWSHRPQAIAAREAANVPDGDHIRLKAMAVVPIDRIEATIGATANGIIEVSTPCRPKRNEHRSHITQA